MTELSRNTPTTTKPTRYTPDRQSQTTDHGTTQPTATEPLSKAAWGATEPATCTHTRTPYRASKRQRRREAGRGRRMREKAGMSPDGWALSSFPLEKNRRMRGGGGGAEEGGSALPSVGAVGGASLCRCRSHQSQGPCTGSTGRGGGT